MAYGCTLTGCETVSWDAVKWAMKYKLPATHKEVLLTLAYHFNKDDGKCNPGIATLKEETGLKDRAIQGALKQLGEWGIVEIDEGGKGGRSKHTSYLLHTENPAPETVFVVRGKVKTPHLVQRNPASDTENPASGAPAYKESDLNRLEPLREPKSKTGALEAPFNFDSLKNLLDMEKEKPRNKNVTGLLGKIYQQLFPARAADFGRIGKLEKRSGAHDVLAAMWKASANGIQGDPLDYITKMLGPPKPYANGRVRSRDGADDSEKYAREAAKLEQEEAEDRAREEEEEWNQSRPP